MLAAARPAAPPASLRWPPTRPRWGCSAPPSVARAWTPGSRRRCAPGAGRLSGSAPTASTWASTSTRWPPCWTANAKAVVMAGAEPGKHARRDWLRPVPEHKPPHNLEAEEAVLGAVLSAGRLLAEVAAQIEEADFYRPAHRAVWRALLRLADRGEPTDPVTVLGELADSGELADVGGGPFLHTLVQAVPTVANAAHYARLVADTARRRRVIDLGIRLAHSDADPAVLAHLAGELAHTTTAAHGGHGWALPIPFGMAGPVPMFPVEVLPGWLG